MNDPRKLDAIRAQFAHLTAEFEDAAAVAVDGQGACTVAEARTLHRILKGAMQSIAERVADLRELVS